MGAMKPPKETSIGGPVRSFPSTRWSMIVQARDPASPDYRESINELCLSYWKPVYAAVCASGRCTHEEAKDSTQDFFVEVIEGGMLERFQSERGSFRGYLKGALRTFLIDRYEAAGRLKRGGGRRILSLDESAFDGFEPARGATPEEEFDRQWARSVLDHAIEDLRAELFGAGKEAYFRLFERYELEGEETTYARMAADSGLAETDVANYLHHCRSRLREIVRDRVRDYVDREADVQTEMQHVFTLLAAEG